MLGTALLSDLIKKKKLDGNLIDLLQANVKGYKMYLRLVYTYNIKSILNVCNYSTYFLLICSKVLLLHVLW